MAALVLVVLPIVLLCLGVPIFVALIAAASIGIVAMNIGTMDPVHVALFGGLDNFPLLAVPLFIFAGEIMGRGGIARRLVEWALSIVGGVRGSLALAAVASSELFGSMSGSSVGCVAAIGTADDSGIDPPGLYRGVLRQPDRLLRRCCDDHSALDHHDHLRRRRPAIRAQAVPGRHRSGPSDRGAGFDLSADLCANRDDPAHRLAALEERVEHDRDAVWALFAPVVILGGIYGGIFTPTEAAGIACVYAILVARFIYHEMTWTDLWQTAMDSARVIAQILIIVSAAGAYSWVVTTSGFPTRLVDTIAGSADWRPGCCS